MHRGLLFALACLLATSVAPAGDKPAPGPLVVIDGKGKEVALKTWRLAAGTRKLPGGPECLEFREDSSTTYQNGILTLVPVASLRKLDYDNDKKTVALVVAAAGKDVTLTGTTKFVGINKLTVEGDAELGGLGAATVKYQGGNPKGGVTSIRFPAAKPAPAVEALTVTFVADDKQKSKHAAAELTALYLVDGAYRTLPYVMFKKTVKIDVAKIAALRRLEPASKKEPASDFEVTLDDGAKHNLTLLTKVDLEKAKSATFVGLLGRVPVGYKLFPPHAVLEMRKGE